LPNPLRLLIVDSSADDAQRIVDHLVDHAIRPEWLRVSTLDGLIHALHQKWHLVISEAELVMLDIETVLVRIQRLSPDLPLIVVASGSVGEALVVRCMRAGARDFLSKHNLARLIPAIEREIAESEAHKQRRLAESALRESELRFSQLTNTLNEVFWLIDTSDWRVVYLSPAFEDLWDHPRSALEERLEMILETIHVEDFDRIRLLLDQHGWGGFNADYRINLADDSVRWLRTRSWPISDIDGVIYRVAAITTDISEQKRLEADRGMLIRALEQTADMVMITNPAGVILYVNAAFEDVTGYSREEVIGQRPSLLKSGFQDEPFYHQVWSSLAAGLPYSDIFINRRKEGDYYYEAKTITPVRDESGTISHYVSTGKNITGQLAGRERLQRLLHRDPATGFANRLLLQERLERALMQAKRMQRMVAVIAVGIAIQRLLPDADNQRLIDALDRAIADRIRQAAGGRSLVARLNRGHYVVLLRSLVERSEALEIVARLEALFSQPIDIDGYILYTVPGIGLSLFPDDGESGNRLLQHADQAMISASSGR
jgi:PAS domain S-box-containing protein/diguanylate cyclase (GGDEF)-like protein